MGTTIELDKIRKITLDVDEGECNLNNLVNILKYNRSISNIKARLPYGVLFSKDEHKWVLFKPECSDLKSGSFDVVYRPTTSIFNKYPLEEVNFLYLSISKNNRVNCNTKFKLCFSVTTKNKNISLTGIKSFHQFYGDKLTIYKYIGTNNLQKQIEDFTKDIVMFFNLYGDTIKKIN